MIREFYSNMKKIDGTYGLEIETETEKSKDYPDKFFVTNHETGHFDLPSLPSWIGHEDGSLRNFGMEFVSKKPLSLVDLRISLLEFKRGTERVNFIKDAPATSIHVHMNITDFSFKELGNLLTTWTLFENVVVEYCGEGRTSNLFALPNRCAETTTSNVVQMFRGIEKGQKNSMSFQHQSTKYGAINLSSIYKFGSLEFRSMRGTTDIEEILQWVEVLDDIYCFSRQAGLCPRKIMTAYRNLGPDFMKEVFQTHHDVLSAGIDIEGFIDRNVWYAGMISDSVTSWDELDQTFAVANMPVLKKRSKGFIGQAGELTGFYSSPPPINATPSPINNSDPWGNTTPTTMIDITDDYTTDEWPTPIDDGED